MSSRLVFEVRQRSRVNPLETRELGVFEDSSLAEQAIDRLYHKVWSVVAHHDFGGNDWFLPEDRSYLTRVGIDFWIGENKRLENPIFYMVPHVLYNQVPAMTDDLLYTLESFPPPESKLARM